MSENQTIDEAIEAIKKKLYKADGTLKSNASPVDLARLEELTAQKSAGGTETQSPTPDGSAAKTEETTEKPLCPVPNAEAIKKVQDDTMEGRLKRVEEKLDTMMTMLTRAGVIRPRKFIDALQNKQISLKGNPNDTRK